MTGITADPVFQLNCILWMLQPLPDIASAPTPVLHNAGYRVHYIGAQLVASPDTESRLSSRLGVKGSAAPDVIASAPDGAHWLAIECKASSFGPESSTSNQALKILAHAADLSPTVVAAAGTTVAGAAVYVTRVTEAAALYQTLTKLASRLSDAGISPAPVAALGLAAGAGTGVTVQLVDGTIPGPAGAALAQVTTLIPAAAPEEADPRPLYILPYDPSVTQTDLERQRCLQILIARGRAAAAARIGRCTDEGTLTVDGGELLESATYGVSRYWQDRHDHARTASLILDFVKAAIRDMGKRSTTGPVPQVERLHGPDRLKIQFVDADQRQATAEAVISCLLPDAPGRDPALHAELPFGSRA